MKYRALKNYKYQLLENITVSFYGIEFNLNKKYIILPEYILMKKDDITISKGYAWDGASGPAIDTKNIMIPSLVHDALYQLIKIGVLDKTERKKADDVLKALCIKEGMSKFRANYIYLAVRLFGGLCLKTGSSNQKIYEV